MAAEGATAVAECGQAKCCGLPGESMPDKELRHGDPKYSPEKGAVRERERRKLAMVTALTRDRPASRWRTSALSGGRRNRDDSDGAAASVRQLSKVERHRRRHDVMRGTDRRCLDAIQKTRRYRDPVNNRASRAITSPALKDASGPTSGGDLTSCIAFPRLSW